MKQKLLLILVLIITSCGGNTRSNQSVAQVHNRNSEENKIQKEIIKKVEFSMQENNIPALSIGVIKDGKVYFTSGFGSLKLNSSDSIKSYSVFQIASLSKLLTGIITRSLEIEDIIDINDPITNYLSDKISKKAQHKLREVKIKHLLFHNSGFPHNSIVLQRIDGEPMKNGYTSNQLLQDLEKLELESAPGEKFAYSNLGFAILGFILEEASGFPYSKLLEKYISKPYNMESTFSNPENVETKYLAIPYRKDNRQIETSAWKTGKLTPASGIYSNVEDLVNLMASQISTYDEDKNEDLILTEEKTSRGNEGSYYGYGIFEDKTKRGTIYGHRGDMDGFASEYTFNPDRNVGVVILTSSGGRWAGLLAAQIMKILEEDSISK